MIALKVSHLGFADVQFRTTVRTRTSRTGQYVQVRFALRSGRIQVVRSSVLARGVVHEQVQNLSERGRTTYGDEKNVAMEVDLPKYIVAISPY